MEKCISTKLYRGSAVLPTSDHSTPQREKSRRRPGITRSATLIIRYRTTILPRTPEQPDSRDNTKCRPAFPPGNGGKATYVNLPQRKFINLPREKLINLWSTPEPATSKVKRCMQLAQMVD